MATRAQLRRIGEAELLVKQCATALEEAEAELREARLDASPVKPGDIVIALGRRYKGEEVKVVSVDTRYARDDKPWVRVTRRKKNGEWGAGVIAMFSDWELKP